MNIYSVQGDTGLTCILEFGFYRPLSSRFYVCIFKDNKGSMTSKL